MDTEGSQESQGTLSLKIMLFCTFYNFHVLVEETIVFKYNSVHRCMKVKCLKATVFISSSS